MTVASCVKIPGTFLCCPMQNNMIRASAALSEEGESLRLFLKISISVLTQCFIFSFYSEKQT